MQWRRLQLDWKYAVGELVIVTAEVLIALGIDQWNTVRLDRMEERGILDQLAADVRIVFCNIEYALDLLGTWDTN